MTKRKPPEEHKKNGRPSKYTQELADKICTMLAQGNSLRTVGKEKWCPDLVTIFSWMRKFPEFLKQYEKAKEESADVLFEDILDIADNGSNDWMEVNDKDNPGYKMNGEAIQRSRLRVDARKWAASKLKPKKYGDKLAIGGTDDLPPVQQIISYSIPDNQRG